MFKTRFISMLVLLAAVVTGAWAQPWTSGDCTVTLTDDGVLIVSGTGAMADYTKVSEQPWASYRSSITSIVVGEGVTHIGNFALMACNKATSVSLSSSLTSIGASAFQQCNNAGFTSIAIPANVETIGDKAFHSCNKLTQVNIPDKVTSIGQNAFYGCTAVTSITVGKSVTSIGEMAFRNCSAMTTLAVKAPACALGTYALDACSSLTTIYVTTDKADYYKTADGWSAYAAKIQAGYDISLKEGTEDAYKWAIMPGLAAEGDAVTLQYNGTKKVKSVKAVKKAAAAPTLAATMTTAGMTVKVNYNYNDEENYCLFVSNGDGTYTFDSGEGYAGGDNCAKALVVEDGKLVFKQNFFTIIDVNWDKLGFSVTFDTSNNTYSEWIGSQNFFNPSFISVEVNGTTIAVTAAQ